MYWWQRKKSSIVFHKYPYDPYDVKFWPLVKHRRVPSITVIPSLKVVWPSKWDQKNHRPNCRMGLQALFGRCTTLRCQARIWLFWNIVPKVPSIIILSMKDLFSQFHHPNFIEKSKLRHFVQCPGIRHRLFGSSVWFAYNSIVDITVSPDTDISCWNVCDFRWSKSLQTRRFDKTRIVKTWIHRGKRLWRSQNDEQATHRKKSCFYVVAFHENAKDLLLSLYLG